MGAPNFGRGNASKIFTMFFPYEQPVLDDEGNETEETEYVHPESYEIEEEIENIKDALKALPYSNYGINIRNRRDERGLVQLRDYKMFGDVEVYVEVDCFLEYGYHEGAILDWEVRLTVNGSEYDDDIDLSHVQGEFDYASEMSKGLQIIQSKHAFNWLQAQKTEMIAKVEDVYDELSGLKLECVAQFSNGEAFYKEIE